MEVKINREIRNYTESLFFGLSLRQSIFSFLAIAVAVVLGFAGKGQHRGSLLDLRVWRSPLCSYGLCDIPRHDSGTVCMGVAPIGGFGTTLLPQRTSKHILRADEKPYRSKGKGGAKSA